MTKAGGKPFSVLWVAGLDYKQELLVQDKLVLRMMLTACKDIRLASFADCRIGRSSSDESESSLRLG